MVENIPQMINSLPQGLQLLIMHMTVTFGAQAITPFGNKAVDSLRKPAVKRRLEECLPCGIHPLWGYRGGSLPVRCGSFLP